MADIDELLTADPGGIAQRAAEAAEAPDFGSVARRGRGRRTRRQAGMVGAAALAVTAVVGIAQVLGPGDDRGPGPTEQSSVATTSPARPLAELAAVADAADSTITDLAVVPGNAEVMAVIWSFEELSVLAVTGDGFESRSLVEVPTGSIVEPLSSTTFVLREGWDGKRIRIIGSDAPSGVTVTVTGRETPARADEVPVVLAGAGSREGPEVVAVAADGGAHPVPTPAGLSQVTVYGGRLSGVAWGDPTVYHWSDDGGATWSSEELGRDIFNMSVRSAIGQDHAVLEGGDGATLFPAEALHFASAASPEDWTRMEFPRGGETHWTVDGAWHEDGDLRLMLTEWEKGTTVRDSGVWRLVVGDLRVPGEREGLALEKVGDRPFGNTTAVGPVAFEYVDGPVVWVTGPRGELARTQDGGATWQRFRSR
ncbi:MULTISPECIES: hypothetical protein [Nocardioides]|uniref:Exo-alpha-sialidase n=1 Tax=Nocardioides vastitatis TaxID=2568655 RepID=A0ABW0ZF84_9ACTN|nr:hypothetical protein [Nocardioides sp.]THI94729.1 hypothetical protein E7Z54_19895 [Nocardioides sp.]